MTSISSILHELFGNEPADDPPTAPALVANNQEDPTMQTTDQKAIAAVFSDLYGKIDTLTSTVSQQASQIASLQNVVSQHSAPFDTSLITGYAPPVPAGGASVPDDPSSST